MRGARAAAILLCLSFAGRLNAMGAHSDEPFEILYSVEGARPPIALVLHILRDGKADLFLGTSDSLPRTGTDAVGDFAGYVPAPLLRTIGEDLDRAGLPDHPPREAEGGLPPSVFRSMTVQRGGRSLSLRVPDDGGPAAYQALEGHLIDAARALVPGPRRSLTARLAVPREGDGIRPTVVLRSVGSEPSVFAAADPQGPDRALSIELLLERGGEAVSSTRISPIPATLAPGATMDLPLPHYVPPSDGSVELRAVVDFILPGPGGSTRRARLRTVAVAVSARTPSPEAGAAPVPPSLSLSVTGAKPGYARGEAIVVRVSLKNTDDRPVTVNGRMLLNHSFAPDPYRDLTMEVAGPQGYQNSVVYSVKAGPPSAKDAVRLAPGEVLTRTIDLAAYESLHEPGTYRIVFRYRNSTRIEGVDAWQGEIAAPPWIVERNP